MPFTRTRELAQLADQIASAMKRGDDIAGALYESGYGSSSRLYEGAAAKMGMTPATYAKGGAGAQIDFTTVDSDYGRVLVAATRKGIAAVFLGDNDRALEK